MKSIEQIFHEAKVSPREYEGIEYRKDDEYNPSYLLSHEQIHAAALLKIQEQNDITLNDTVKKYYVDGISLVYDERGKEPDLSMETLEVFFGNTINNAINEAKKGMPSFISIDNGKHFVLVAIVPEVDNPNKLSVVYVNSMPQSLPEYADHPFSQTGKKFADSLLSYITEKQYESGIELGNTQVIDKSQEQQLANCCGLSVASNIASIATHHADNKSLASLNDSMFKPKNASEKEAFYKAFGNKLFTKLDDPKLDFNSNASEVRGKQQNKHEENLTNTLEEVGSKTKVDIKDPLHKIAAEFGKGEEVGIFLSQVPIKTTINMDVKEQGMLENATEQAIKEKSLHTAYSKFEDLCPENSKSLVSPIVKYLTQLISNVKHWVKSIVNSIQDNGRSP
ncbi:hypothetical protein NF27_EY00450 [Candidatus Jidaibacter acanthamoeba]|uniref:Uncharacterized protein n=1 Tax=Candidatus Jidaibacter acanthamoebae TaxID=86105 RepID=A0A0C1QHC8_9RICK|nr:hypothetical protein [Candidatus Jidaibacter acanthamoeba]KIE04949.1 hypothetical protein NF27_EY00450 [Candidatus Jidaibacter acanthamoeba]